MDRIPFPLEDGWRVRCFHLIRALAQANDVTVLSFGLQGDPAAGAFLRALGVPVRLRLVPPVKRYGPWRLLKGLLGPDPITVVNERSARYHEAVREELNGSPDLVLCELVAMLCQLDGLRAPPVVIDTHNIDSLVMQRYADTMSNALYRLYARVTAAKLAKYERRAFRAADLVIVCSEVEAEKLKRTQPGIRVCVVPNGIEASQFSRSGAADVDRRRILFFGKLNYFPNRDAIDYFSDMILPRIRSLFPDSEFHVAGAGADAALESRIRAMPGTTYHGRVDNLAPLIASAAVVVVPLRSGGGTRLKVLEALAAGRPVVSTTVGAEGLDLQGRGVVIADAPDEFARATVSLLRDSARADAVGTLGRAAVLETHEWGRIGLRFTEALAALPSQQGG